MSRILQIGTVIGLGLLATACEKCGNSNFNIPHFCGNNSPRS